MNQTDLKLWVEYKNWVDEQNAPIIKNHKKLSDSLWADYQKDLDKLKKIDEQRRKEYEQKKKRLEQEEAEYDAKSWWYKFWHERPVYFIHSPSSMSLMFWPPIMLSPTLIIATQEGFMDWLAKKQKLLK